MSRSTDNHLFLTWIRKSYKFETLMLGLTRHNNSCFDFFTYIFVTIEKVIFVCILLLCIFKNTSAIYYSFLILYLLLNSIFIALFSLL